MIRVSHFHFILLCIYFPLSLFSSNQDELNISNLGVPLLYSLLFGIFLWLVLWLILRNNTKASILTSLVIFLFFSHGFFNKFISGKSWFTINILGVGLGRVDLLFIVYFIIIVLGILLVLFSSVNLTKISQLIACTALVLVAIPTINILYYQLNKHINQQSKVQTLSNINLQTSQHTSLPDIFYIILDRYPNAEILKHYYGYNNSVFLSKLADKGFYIVSNSFANYLKTAQSLAASLNMQYINYLSPIMKNNPSDWTPIYRLMLKNKLLSLVKKLGYKTVWAGSWWGPTATNMYCDDNIIYNFTNLFAQNEFAKMFLETTALYSVLIKFYPQKYDFRYIQWKRVQYKIDKLKKVSCFNKPIFVFAHFLLPHPPFVFYRDGNFVKYDIPLNYPNKKLVRTRWLDQLIYTNDVILDLVTYLLENRKNSPIIILQGDEGPFPERYADGEDKFNWKTQATKREIYKKFGILNAIYLPTATKRKQLYNTMTPVNTFRVISNLYFGSSFKILPDKSYIFENHQNIYSFKDITDVLREYHAYLLSSGAGEHHHRASR